MKHGALLADSKTRTIQFPTHALRSCDKAGLSFWICLLLLFGHHQGLHGNSAGEGHCASGCGYLIMGGGNPGPDGACSTVLSVPCQLIATAFATINSTNAACPIEFIQQIPDTDVDWTIKSATGGTAKGLQIQGKGPVTHYANQYWAEIYVDRSQVQPGTYEVIATPTRGTPQTGKLIIEFPPECGASESWPVCLQNNPFGNLDTGNGSVAARINLGKYGFGKNVGSLSIHEKYPTNLLSKPMCVGFLFPHGTNNTDCETMTNHCGLWQLKVPEGIANCVTNSDFKYSIELYSSSACSGLKDTNGFYILSGTPLATITIENPDTTGATTNQLKITDGDGVISDYEWQTNGWKLVKGGGLRTETKSTIVSGDIRTTTLATLGTNGAVAHHSRRYKDYAFGEKLIEEVKGLGATSLTNRFDYHTNVLLVSKGLLKTAEYGTGGWEVFTYETNGFKTNAILPFLNVAPTSNSATARSFEYRYGSNAIVGSGDSGRRRPSQPRVTVEYIQGHEVGRSFAVYKPFEKQERRAVNPGAQWSDASNLVTLVKYYDSGSNSNRIKSVERPDGTMDIYEYFFYTNGVSEAFRTNIVYSGAPHTNKNSIIDGTRTVTVLGKVGQIFSRAVVDIVTGATNSSEYYEDFDNFNRPRKITYLDGTFAWTDHGCCGPVTETNRDGTTIIYYRDALKREVGVQKNGIIRSNIFDLAGNIIKKTRTGTNGNTINIGRFSFDSIGRQLASTNAMGDVTTYSETITNYQKLLKTTYPDGSTRIEEYYRDGQIAKITGTAVHPVRYEYGTEQDGGVWRLYTKEIKLDVSGADTSEWTKTYKDMVGRDYKTVYSDGSDRKSVV